MNPSEGIVNGSRNSNTIWKTIPKCRSAILPEVLQGTLTLIK